MRGYHWPAGWEAEKGGGGRRKMDKRSSTRPIDFISMHAVGYSLVKAYGVCGKVCSIRGCYRKSRAAAGAFFFVDYAFLTPVGFWLKHHQDINN